MLWQLSALDAAEQIRKGLITSEGLVGACLDRIGETDGAIGAWAHLDRDRALEQARAMDRLRQTGKPMGALHGVPVGVKDIFDTADMPTQYNTPVHEGRQPERDCTVISRLREAGAVIMGKTVTTEFAFLHPADTCNPHDPARSPGGSSSGSAAAVAAGHVPLAIGTQTNGSVIRPASFCGIYGFKPTRGLIPRVGVLQTSKSLDQIGVFSRSLEDAAALADALIGHDRDDPACHDRPKPRVRSGMDGEPAMEPCFAWFDLPFDDRLAEDAREGLQELVAALGGRIEVLPAPDSFTAAVDAQRVIHEYEILRHLHAEVTDHWDLISPSLQPVMERARTYTDSQYEDALELMARADTYFQAFFMDYDAVLAPAAPCEAPLKAQGTGDPIFSTVWTFAGLPCVSLPLLTGASGLPVGAQLIGSAEADDRLFASANWLQRFLDVESADEET